MRVRRWNAAIRLIMAGALLVTGFPLLAAWWPPGPLPTVSAAAGGPQTVPGEIVVDAKDTLSPTELQALNAEYGLGLQENSIHAAEEKLLTSSVPQGQEEAVLARLRHDPLVEAAAPMYRYTRHWTPNDPRYPEQWNLRMVGAEKAWDRNRGMGVVVAVIDTGVAFENDEKCYQGKDFGGTRFAPGYDFVNGDAHPNDDYGHGTHVAGTIAETTNNGEGVAGLAFEATIMPLKVLDAFGSGTTADIADAIRFAADNGAKIINMSLGSPHPDQVLRLACQYAAKKGVLIVCSAGNFGGGPVGYPAGFPECLAVSAVGPDGEIAFYSSVGKPVAIAAPGGAMLDRQDPEQRKNGILQNTVPMGAREDDDYYAYQGTSMAAPHVAATAALVMSLGITDPAQVKEILQRGATPKKPAAKYGAGLLNAAGSVRVAEGTARDSWLKLLFTVVAGLTGVGVGVIRHPARGLLRFPYLPLGFAIGFLAPDLIFNWLGYGSPFNIILHSALIPLYLLWEAESRTVYRFVGILAIGSALHLGWDAFQGHAPFAGVLPGHALPWLWVNTVVGVGIALVAWRRSFSAE